MTGPPTLPAVLEGTASIVVPERKGTVSRAGQKQTKELPVYICVDPTSTAIFKTYLFICVSIQQGCCAMSVC